jgi:competence protein ComEC
VGQGDSAVIETPSGRIVVIDGGGVPGTDEREGRDPGTRVLVPFLRSRGISTVDLLVATHPDDDHVQGLIAVAKRLQVRSVWESGLPTEPNTPAARLQTALADRKIPVSIGGRVARLNLDNGAQLEILHPPKPFLTGGRSFDNDNGIVLRLVYGDLTVLFMADLEETAERDLLRSGQNLQAHVLKVGHHGSRWSSSEAFLKAVNPKAAIISCGRDNNFGHPHPETLERLKGVHIYRTDQQGAITLESDGKTATFMPYLKQSLP